MTWAIVFGGAFLVAAAVVVSIVSPAKLLVGLLGTGLVVSAAAGTVAVTASAASPGPMGGISHAQLEADRRMTEQMVTTVGPGMQSLMTTNAMLRRSANDVYLRALEQHTSQVDRMLARTP